VTRSFDFVNFASVCCGVIRFLLAVLCAAGLVLSPVSVSVAAAAEMPGCAMDGHMPANPADHGKMDCCTPACQLSAPAAMLPEPAAGSDPLPYDRDLLATAAVRKLASIPSSTLDPPPRLLPS
jgi:hypothetical protein